MTVTTRTNANTGQLEIQHPDTQGWLPLVTLMNLVGGFGVQLTNDQIGVITQILTQVNTLSDILNSSNATGSKLLTINGQIASILSNVSNIVSGQQSVVTANNSVNSSVQSLSSNIQSILNSVQTQNTKTDTVNSNLSSIQSLLSILTTLNTNITGVNTNLTTINSTFNNLIATNVNSISYVNLTASTESIFPLPINTKSLSFACRKNSGQFYDIRYAFTANQTTNLSTGNYRTLYASNVYSQSGILWSSKNLYLCCDTAVTVEIEVSF